MAPRDKEPPFLRRPQAVPRKRKRPGALRLVIVGVLALGAGIGLAEFLAGPRFALARFAVSGNSRARTEEILGALAPWNGRNLVALDLAPLAARLAEQPWIDRVTLAKRFPDGLAIRVSERRAIALYRDGERFWWVGVGGRLHRAVRSAARPDRVRDPERRFPRASRGGRPARGSARRAARVFLGALGNRLAPGRRIRYDGWDLSQAGSRSTGRRPGENSRAARGAQFH